MDVQSLESLIEVVPDYPKKGIMFRDITPLLLNGKAFGAVIDHMVDVLSKNNIKPTVIAGVESRGFIFGAAIANKLSLGFTAIRKPGKLPKSTYSCKYDLEYGTDTLEIHKDSLKQSDRVLIVDDILATGGTAAACIDLVKQSDAEIAGLSFLLEICDLKGREKLTDQKINSLFFV